MANKVKINNMKMQELDIYARLSEGQLLHYNEPDTGIFIAESPTVIRLALDAGYEPISILAEEKDAEGPAREIIERCGNISVYIGTFEALKEMTGFAMTRGVLCAMRRKTLPKAEEVCKGARRIAVLENVMNPTNVGAIFRSAAALNMDAVLLTPGCSDPLYRRAARVSMGTVFQIPWTFFDKKQIWPEQGMEILKTAGFRTAAMALSDHSIGIDDPQLAEEKKLALFLGTEGYGLTEKTIANCDYTVKIPMSHGVDSLNVAAASAVAFWELGKKNNDSNSGEK